MAAQADQQVTTDEIIDNMFDSDSDSDGGDHTRASGMPWEDDLPTDAQTNAAARDAAAQRGSERERVKAAAVLKATTAKAKHRMTVDASGRTHGYGFSDAQCRKVALGLTTYDEIVEHETGRLSAGIPLEARAEGQLPPLVSCEQLAAWPTQQLTAVDALFPDNAFMRATNTRTDEHRVVCMDVTGGRHAMRMLSGSGPESHHQPAWRRRTEQERRLNDEKQANDVFTRRSESWTAEQKAVDDVVIEGWTHLYAAADGKFRPVAVRHYDQQRLNAETDTVDVFFMRCQRHRAVHTSRLVSRRLVAKWPADVAGIDMDHNMTTNPVRHPQSLMTKYDAMVGFVSPKALGKTADQAEPVIQMTDGMAKEVRGTAVNKQPSSAATEQPDPSEQVEPGPEGASKAFPALGTADIRQPANPAAEQPTPADTVPTEHMSAAPAPGAALRPKHGSQPIRYHGISTV
jgi:hypothetical protein